ncbi:hypothetical protein PWP89_09680 [Stenotrophomonas rhizophila]|nr:hypothetical protein [Stenotrophomonas rhizophila]
MDAQKVELEIAKLITDSSKIAAYSGWKQFVMGGASFWVAVILAKLVL